MARDPDAKLDTPTFFKHDIERIAKESVAPIVADLVDKAIDDGRINIDDNVQRIIQADKDILSQINVYYDEENDISYISFPRYILPLHLELGDGELDGDLYFDYTTERAIDNENVKIYDIDANGGSVLLSKSGDITNILDIYCMTYMFFNGYQVMLNTYYLFNPAGGTKLYKHYVVGDEECIIISTDNTPIGNDTSKKYEIGENGVVSMYSNSLGLLVGQLYYSNENGWVFFTDDQQQTILSSITDTVTEL